MNRREFVFTSSLMAGFLGRSLPLSAAGNLNRAAIVIGVSQVDGLPTLSSPVPGSEAFASFLEGEGFEVHLHNDRAADVTISRITADVEELFSRDNIDQLVVYFSGHGILSGHGSEYWLLKKAFTHTGDAINLNYISQLAGYSGIPNFVFISDACRSLPDGALRILTGNPIFPKYGPYRETDKDFLFATLPGDPAVEVPVGESSKNYMSLFTQAIFNAYENPTKEMIATIDGVDVVPNRKLEKFLINEVFRLADENRVTQNVRPSIAVHSDDDVYIGRAKNLPLPQPGGGTRGTDEIHAFENSGLTEVLAQELAAEGLETGHNQPRMTEEELRTLKQAVNLEEKLAKTEPRSDLDFGGSSAGIAIYGSELVELGVRPTLDFEILNGNRAALYLDQGDAASGVLRFSDGSGSVIALLGGFGAHVFVDDSGVTNVSYLPTWAADLGEDEMLVRLNRLRGLVAQATKQGIFYANGGESSQASFAGWIADEIRMLKSVDPTLGVYAAYAYERSGSLEQIQSVDRFMRKDLSTQIFDLALLQLPPADPKEDVSIALDGSVAFCPLLRAGWEFLPTKGVVLDEIVQATAEHLRDSLWTSFDEEGVDILMPAIRNGELR